MTKKTIGVLVAALLIAAMLVVTIKTKLDQPEPIDTSAMREMNVSDSETAGNLAVGLKQGALPPDFELQTLAGETVKLSDLKGKKVVLNFWASYCPPCKAEMPHMEKYYKKNKDKENVEILAVNLTTAEKQGVPAVSQFVKSYGLTFPIPMDDTGTVGQQYRIITIPSTYMINTDGTIGHSIVGPMDEKALGELVNSLD